METKSKSKYAKQKTKGETKRQTWLCLDATTLQELDARQARDPVFKSLSRTAFLRYIVKNWLDICQICK